MGGIVLRQPFPTANVEQLDPFLLLHHHSTQIPAGSSPRDLGVGPHPHRGFSPVTFIFEGSIHHRDSRQNSSVIDKGGVQWMDAGMGIIHSERPSKTTAENGGAQEIIQVWINTPKAHKMDQPDYQPLQGDELPEFKPSQGEGVFKVVCGQTAGLQGPVRAKLNALIIMGHLEAGAFHTLEAPSEMNCALYLLDGQLRVEGYGLVDGLNLIHFANDHDEITIEARENTRILLLAGEPINEPVTHYGPYVMNTQTEVMEAMRDYQMGKMGILIEEFD